MRFCYLCVCLFLFIPQLASADQRILIIGDSISEHIYCWPNEMRLENPGLNLQLLTQSGRTIRDYTPARDLRNVSKKDVVIYFLGTNDAFSGYPMRCVDESFSSHMVFLQDRGFKVIVILPPVATRLMPRIEKVRQLIAVQSQRLGIDYYDLEFWDETMTRDDGIHPGPELSRMVAEFVYTLLQPYLKVSSRQYAPECNPEQELQYGLLQGPVKR